jgi:hypothetical protein
MAFVLCSSFVLSSSSLKTRTNAGIGYWIIVEGGNFHNLQLVINYGCSQVYNILKGVGYTDDRIRYVAALVNENASLEQAIQWGANMASSSEPLWIYMFDHGKDGWFGLRGAEYIYYYEIANLFDKYDISSNVNINMIIAACYSGLAINTSLSRPGRMIITSCNVDEESRATVLPPVWEAFSDPFWDAIKGYVNVLTAFDYACWNIKNVQGYNQTPLLDDDGNKIGHTYLMMDNDGDLAANLYIGLHGVSSSSVGGIYVPIDKFALLTPYVGLVSTLIMGAIVAGLFVRRAERRKERQES